MRTLPVHPHVRGDHTSLSCAIGLSPGSPPRAWGSRFAAGGSDSASRFTPTCVGITCTGTGGAGGASVHPHVRGDHGSCCESRGLRRGSPPRAWGSLFHDDRLAGQHRFTPTCVGITSVIPSSSSSRSVHPHVRGDHSCRSQVIASSRGSPPRAWGSRGGCGYPSKLRRFTPTCVGITAARTPTPRAAPVHPHVRGDHIAVVSDGCPCTGSPPRAWGSLVATNRQTCDGRFTPTWVGFTGRNQSANRQRAVHPHVRGDH